MENTENDPSIRVNFLNIIPILTITDRMGGCNVFRLSSFVFRRSSFVFLLLLLSSFFSLESVRVVFWCNATPSVREGKVSSFFFLLG